MSWAALLGLKPPCTTASDGESDVLRGAAGPERGRREHLPVGHPQPARRLPHRGRALGRLLRVLPRHAGESWIDVYVPGHSSRPSATSAASPCRWEPWVIKFGCVLWCPIWCPEDEEQKCSKGGRSVVSAVSPCRKERGCGYSCIRFNRLLLVLSKKVIYTKKKRNVPGQSCRLSAAIAVSAGKGCGLFDLAVFCGTYSISGAKFLQKVRMQDSWTQLQAVYYECPLAMQVRIKGCLIWLSSVVSNLVSRSFPVVSSKCS